jgi:hypothetical protein
MIKLKREDWREIYYALELKSQALKQGRYGTEDYRGQDAAWIAHLDAILRKIGPDGRAAALYSVSRTGVHKP